MMLSAFAFLCLGLIIGTVIGFLYCKNFANNSHDDLLKQVEKVNRSNFSEVAAQMVSDSKKQQGVLEELVRTSNAEVKSLVDSTNDVRSLLFNNQARGMFGEDLLQTMVDRMGMVKGVHYFKQQVNEDSLRPDYTFVLPGNKTLAVDCKFPFASYAAISGNDDKQHINEFFRDVKKHVDDLVKRGYHTAENSVSFSCLMIANDEIFSFVQKNNPDLFTEAMKKNILICSPVLIFPLLGIIMRADDVLKINRNAKEFMTILQKFESEWGKHGALVAKVENALNTALKAVEDLTTTRDRAYKKLCAEREVLSSEDK